MKIERQRKEVFEPNWLSVLTPEQRKEHIDWLYTHSSVASKLRKYGKYSKNYTS